MLLREIKKLATLRKSLRESLSLSVASFEASIELAFGEAFDAILIAEQLENKEVVVAFGEGLRNLKYYRGDVIQHLDPELHKRSIDVALSETTSDEPPAYLAKHCFEVRFPDETRFVILSPLQFKKPKSLNRWEYYDPDTHLKVNELNGEVEEWKSKKVPSEADVEPPPIANVTDLTDPDLSSTITEDQPRCEWDAVAEITAVWLLQSLKYLKVLDCGRYNLPLSRILVMKDHLPFSAWSHSGYFRSNVEYLAKLSVEYSEMTVNNLVSNMYITNDKSV